MTKNESFLSKALGRFGLEIQDSSTRAIEPASETRTGLGGPESSFSLPAEWMLDIFSGGRTDTGLRANEVTALQVTTVVQCVNIISNGLASNPLNVYERTVLNHRVGKKIDRNHDLFYLLHNEPNEEMTSFTWRKTLMCHILLWGNGYTEIQRDRSNKIIALWPRNPARTRPVRLTEGATIEGTYYRPGTLVYETYEDIGERTMLLQDSAKEFGPRRIVLAEDMLHIPGLSLDGRLGQDVIQMGRQAIGLALAAEKYGAKFFGNGAVPQGILQVPADMTELQWDVLKRSWVEAHGGENAHKTGVLPPGVTYQKTAATPEEGQMLETRENQKVEVASLFNVPGHMVGVKGDGKSTVEQGSLEFLMFCLGPHNFSWEQEMERKLFSFDRERAKQSKFFAGFDVRKLMYPDAASRSTLYGSGKQWGYMNTNDIHELEGMNPVEDPSGDIYWMPVNVQDASVAAEMAQERLKQLKEGIKIGTVPPPDAPPEETKAQRTDELKRMFTGMFRDAVGRASHRSKPTVSDYVTIFGPLTISIAESIHEDSVEASEFVRGYTADLFEKRATAWGEDLDAVAAVELDNLIDMLMKS